MSQNRGTFQYGITFDTSSAKKSLQELEALMSKMDKMSVGDFMKVSGETNFYKAAGELQDLQTELKKVKTAYKEAFDSKLGVVNMQEFLKKTGSNIQDLSQKFNRMGAAGSKAFASMHANSIKISSAFRETNTLLDKMGKSLMNTIKWNISSSLVNTFTSKVQEAYGYVKHLDSSLNDIRIVTGKSADEMSRFAKEANQAAQQLGKTTTDYTEASLIYYQQGLSDSDVKNMTDLTLKASNVTGEATSQVSEYFTALKNGYQIATEDMESQVDKMAAVAASTASDLGELSTAVSRVASTAAASGVGLDSLIAQISTIESVTRQAPESIGTALKTVYARLGDLKVDGSIIDEDGFEVKLGEVSGQLQQMGVNILDVNGNMRDQQDVIEEIGAKWQNWTKEQKEAAAIAMAGKRQYNNLFALFENFDQYNKAMETSAGALGTLQKQQEIYEESTEYHLNKLTTQWEDFYDSMLDTHTINTVTDLFTGLLKGITTITDALGGGVNVLTTFIGLMGQLQSKNIVNTFVKPIIDQKFAKQFSDNNIAQVQANIQSWQAGGKISNSAVAAQQEYAKTMSPYMSNFTKEDAQSYNSAIDELGQSGEKIRELEIDIEKTTKDIKDLREGFLDTFQLSREETGLSEEEFKSFKESVLQVFDTIGEKAPQDLEKFGDAIDKLFKKKLNQAVDDAQIRLQELEQALKKMDIVDGKGPGQHNYSAGTKSKKRREIMNSVNVEKGSYSTNREALTAAIEEQKKKVQELKEVSTEYNGVIEKTDEQVQKLAENTQHLSQSEEEKAAREKALAADLEAKLLEAQKQAAQKRAQHYVEVAGAVTTLASSLNSLINIGNTVKGMLDGSIPPLQGVLTIVTTLGMTIPMLITSLTKLVTTEVGANAVVAIGNKLHLKNIAVLSAETLAQDGLNAALVEGDVAASSFWASLLGPIALVVAGVVAVVAIVDKLTMSEKEATEQLENYNKTWEEHNSNIDNINSKIEENLRLIEEIKSKNDLSAQDEERIQNLQRQNKELKEQVEWEKTLALQDYIDNKKENDKAIETKEKEFNEGIHGFKRRYAVNGEVRAYAVDEDIDFDTVVEEFNKQTEIINKNKAELLTTKDETVRAQLHKEIEDAELLREAYRGDIIEIQKVAKANKADVEVQKKGAEAGGEPYKDDVKEYDEKIQDYDKYLNIRLEKTQEEKDAEDKIWSNEENKKTKFDWYATDDKGNSKAKEFNTASKDLFNRMSAAPEGTTMSSYDYEHSDFKKLIDETGAELDKLVGKDIAKEILNIDPETEEGFNKLRNLLEHLDSLSKNKLGMSDGVLDSSEIETYSITLDDVDKSLVAINKDLTDNGDEVISVASAMSSWNDVVANSIKQLGVTEDRFNAVQDMLVKQNPALKDNKEKLQKLAYEYLKVEKALKDSKSALENYNKLLKDSETSDLDKAESLRNLGRVLSTALEFPEDALSPEFIQDNMDLITKAVEDGGEAINELQQQLLANGDNQFYISLGLDEESIPEFQEMYQEIIAQSQAYASSHDMTVGANIDASGYYNVLKEMLTTAGLTTKQITAVLSSLNLELSADNVETLNKLQKKITQINNLPSDVPASYKEKALAEVNQAIENLKVDFVVGPPKKGVGKTPTTGGKTGGSNKGSTPKQTDLSIDKLDTKEQIEPMEEEVDRYHKIDTAIQMTENSLERYGKIKDKVFGTDLIKNNEEEIKNLNKEIDQLTTKFDIAAKHQDEMADKLIDKGFTFNEDGTLKNFQENLENRLNNVNKEVADYKKDIKKYNKQIKKFNTEAYKEEEKSQKLKFTDKEEKKYNDLTAKVNKAKKEAQKKDTYDKLKDEEKKYLGLKESEKKELKSLYDKLGKQKKLQKDFDRWKYLKEKETEANLSKKEKKELEKFETKYKNLAGAAARLAKEEKKLDDRADAIEKMKEDYSETADLAAEYDSHVSQFMEEIVGQIDEKILAISEKKLDSLHLTFTVSLDLDNAQKQWTEWQNTISMASFSDNVVTKSNLKAIDTIYGNRKNEAEEWFKENDINSTINNIRTATSARDAWLASTDNARSLGSRLSEIGEEKSKLQEKIKKAEDDKDKKKVSNLKKELANLNKEEEQLLKDNKKLDKEVETKLKEYQESFNSTDYGVNLQAYRDDLKENIDAWLSWGAELATNLNEQYQLLGECLNQTREKFEKLATSIDNIIDANKTVISMTEKMYGTDSEQTQTLKTRLYGDNVEKSQNKITVLVEESKTLETQRDKLQARIDKETNQNRKDILQKELDTVKNAITENDKALINATNASLDEIVTNTEYANQLALQQAKKQVWNGKDGDFEKRKFDWQMSDEKSYYDPVNKAYQIQSLIAKKQKEIAKIDNVGKQQRITKLLKEQTDYLQEQAELTEYQVKRAEKILDIELARIALEEAQNNKSTLRLRRDSQGNYSYQYTSDEDDVADKQQKLMDSYVQLYNMDKEQMNKIQQEIINNREKWAEEIQKTQIEYYQKNGKELPQEQVDAMITRAQKEENSLMNQLNEARENIESKFVLGAYGSGKLAESALKDFEFYTSEMLSWNDSISDIINGSAPTLTKTLTELSTTTNAKLEKGTADMEKSFTMAGAKINETTEKVNTETIPAFQDLSKEIKTTGKEADTLSGKIQQINTDFNTTFTTITGHMDEYKNTIDKFETEALPKIKDAQKAYEDLGKEILKAKQAQDNLNGGGGGSTTNNGGDTNNNTTNANNNPTPTLLTPSNITPSFGNGITQSTPKKLKKITDLSKIAEGATVYVNPKADIYSQKDGKFTKEKTDGMGGSLEANKRTIKDIKQSTNKKGTFIKIKEGWVQYLGETEFSNGSDIKNLYAYRSGGYTGDWGSDEGRIGILHEKELVLNKQDTENILAAVQYMRDSILLNAMQSRMSGMSSGGAAAPTQNIQITANFPNASNHSEIEIAFNNLLNRANQYMGRKF